MKNSRFRWTGLLLTICAFVLCLGLAADTASAQESKAKVADKGMASKHGVSESLGNKEIEGDKLPGVFEISMGIGSCFVMVAVMKYL